MRTMMKEQIITMMMEMLIINVKIQNQTEDIILIGAQ